jgi:hypothetical protein
LNKLPSHEITHTVTLNKLPSHEIIHTVTLTKLPSHYKKQCMMKSHTHSNIEQVTKSL